MTTYAEIWKTLSAIDVSAKVEKKQNMTYLSWAWAWGVLMEHYPQATYEFIENTVEKDGTVSVNVTMDIDGCKRYMWLPVMANGNKAIANPDAFIINKNKMRCLVKCMAMYGLGHYIYAGEDLPDAANNDADAMWQAALVAVKTAPDIEALKKHYTAAYSLCSTPTEQQALTTLKDNRKKELSA
jgi:hypothetical protein